MKMIGADHIRLKRDESSRRREVLTDPFFHVSFRAPIKDARCCDKDPLDVDSLATRACYLTRSTGDVQVMKHQSAARARRRSSGRRYGESQHGALSAQAPPMVYEQKYDGVNAVVGQTHRLKSGTHRPRASLAHSPRDNRTFASCIVPASGHCRVVSLPYRGIDRRRSVRLRKSVRLKSAEASSRRRVAQRHMLLLASRVNDFVDLFRKFLLEVYFYGICGCELRATAVRFDACIDFIDEGLATAARLIALFATRSRKLEAKCFHWFNGSHAIAPSNECFDYLPIGVGR
jgi:hypothetical protein